jgi:homoserine kinase
LNEIFLRAPATIANFGPGFDVFALALDAPFDRFRIRRTDDPGVTVRIVDGAETLPTEPDRNTAGLAALHFFKTTGVRGGAEIEIHKAMPIASGLGSSAASAVAAAFGLDRLFGTGLAPADAIEIASQGEAASGGAAHADNVSASFLGGFIIVRNRHPLRIDRLAPPAIPIVVRVRRKSLTTSRGLIPDHLPLAHAKEQMAWCAAVVHAMAAGDLARIGEAINRDHISEPVRSSYIAGYAALKARALEAGALGFNVSGGGSSVFAICPPDRLEAVAGVMRLSAEADAAGAPLVIVTKSSNEGVRDIHGL